MPLNIKNEQVSTLAHRLAKATGESITDAVGKAIEERLTHVERRTQRKGLAERAMEIGRECAEIASKTPEGREWLVKDFDAELYDERGLPKED